MTITLGTIPFDSTIHETPNVPMWEYQRIRQTFFGVAGEVVFLGAAEGRDITIVYTMTGHSSHDDLQDGIAQFNLALGESGDLIIDLGGGDTTTYTNCIFYGFEPQETPWLDGSGVNGWQCKGTLRFRQIAGGA